MGLVTSLCNKLVLPGFFLPSGVACRHALVLSSVSFHMTMVVQRNCSRYSVVGDVEFLSADGLFNLSSQLLTLTSLIACLPQFLNSKSLPMACLLNPLHSLISLSITRSCNVFFFF